MNRSSGILLHISSLPSPYGIGNLGQAAKEFVDFLAMAGQHYWQLLPTSPTGYGDSPYQAASAFAGNPYFIDPEQLLREGLLTEEELSVCWGEDPAETDYGRLYELRLPLLRRAFARADTENDGAFADFCRQETHWLDDYALFMAVKDHFGGKAWLMWDADIRMRRPEAMEAYSRRLQQELQLHKWLQYRFFRQWDALRDYAHSRGVSIIGDIPIYVPMDSADVWSAPKNYQLREDCTPLVVAGCPPDGFTEDGQRWGNPIYDWDSMERDGFTWWLRRIGGTARLFDVVRIDHFRGIESYWSIPAEDKTARNGRWVKGPGRKLVDAIRGAYPDTVFIAEDLGFVTPEVKKLVDASGFPGMKILEFAFDTREPGDYLPHNYNENCVCYTGTHDNATLRQWYEESEEQALDRAFAREYMQLHDGEDFCEAIIRLGMQSRADLFMAQMQDYLDLGAEARMNEPGVVKKQNWRWRMLPGAASAELAAKIADLTSEAGRL